MRKILWMLLCVGWLGLLAGCATVRFYNQAIWGQLRLLQARTPVDDMLQHRQTSSALAGQLRTAQSVIEFAQSDIGIAPNGRYASFVAVPADHVVWNLFAAKPDSLRGVQWCYPIVGCAPYRGFFAESAALQAAAEYERQGYEIYVAGVAAYSTLGWFDDPLLSTFIQWPPAELAHLLIHELAHGRVWAKNDVTFNESFAEFVAIRGTWEWLLTRGLEPLQQSYLASSSVRRAFNVFLLQAKRLLQEVYDGAPPPGVVDKAGALQAIRQCYQHNRERLGAGRYDRMIADHLNNAFFVSVGAYSEDVPAFAALFNQSKQNWSVFFDAVDDLARMQGAARRNRVAQLKRQQRLAEHKVDDTGNDRGANEVDCQAFAGHPADGDTPS